MLISDFIKELTAVLESNGDMNIVINASDYVTTVHPKDAEVIFVKPDYDGKTSVVHGDTKILLIG